MSASLFHCEPTSADAFSCESIITPTPSPLLSPPLLPPLCVQQVVSNCLNALQEIYTSEAHKGDAEAVRDLEDLHSKPVVFALLNR